MHRCARKVLDTISAPIDIEGHLLVITVSIGLCIYPDSGQEIDQILRHADTAMYTVKAKGRNGISPYSPEKPLPASSSYRPSDPEFAPHQPSQH